MCFVSELFGGSVSDCELIVQCGLLNLLEPGDSLMADQGFMIADLLEPRGVGLNIPPQKLLPQLTEPQGVGLNIPPQKLLPQLTENELVDTRRIASV